MIGAGHSRSLTFKAVGNLARNPEAVAKGKESFTRFCLVSNDFYESATKLSQEIQRARTRFATMEPSHGTFRTQGTTARLP